MPPDSTSTPGPATNASKGRAQSQPPRKSDADLEPLPTFSLVDHQFNVPSVTALFPHSDGVAICASKDDFLRQIQRFTGSTQNVAVVTPCQYSDVALTSEPVPLQFRKTLNGKDSQFVAS
eukprot:2844509-Amphidinium_carterae.1